jgi:hypothetical protein
MRTRTRTIVIKVGRDARTGRFICVKAARRRPNTTVVQRIRVRVRCKR